VKPNGKERRLHPLVGSVNSSPQVATLADADLETSPLALEALDAPFIDVPAYLSLK
jgi:hypothetical protein